MSTPASITITRRIEWIDTDAAGIYHWTTAMRLAEAAEAELHTSLGIAQATFGVTPRVKVGFEFLRPVRFNDLVTVTLEVQRVGTSSVTQLVRIEEHGELCAAGEIVACHISKFSNRACPWPADLRERLEHGGDQTTSSTEQ